MLVSPPSEAFKSEQRKLVYSYQGYSTNIFVPPLELGILRVAIKEQWLYRIQIADPSVASIISKNNINISEYHLVSQDLNHAALWGKTTRVLSASFFDWFKKSAFFNTLKEIFGLFEISDEENLGWPNIYWRLVRPNEASDIGPIHRDAWFWELNNNFPLPDFPFHRVKVWIPIYVEPGANGLLVEPFSQQRNDIRWNEEERHGINKPVLLMNDNELKPILVETIPGQAVVFNDLLLHGGAVNKGELSRVSLEFTMLLRNS